MLSIIANRPDHLGIDSGYFDPIIKISEFYQKEGLDIHNIYSMSIAISGFNDNVIIFKIGQFVGAYDLVLRQRPDLDTIMVGFNGSIILYKRGEMEETAICIGIIKEDGWIVALDYKKDRLKEIDSNKGNKQ